MDISGQVWTRVVAKRNPTHQIDAIVWTFLDRSRPNFHCQGGKTGGPRTAWLAHGKRVAEITGNQLVISRRFRALTARVQKYKNARFKYEA